MVSFMVIVDNKSKYKAINDNTHKYKAINDIKKKIWLPLRKCNYIGSPLRISHFFSSYS